MNSTSSAPVEWVLDEAALNEWVAYHDGGRAWPTSYRALGVARGHTITAAVVLYDFTPWNCMVNIAVTDPASFRRLLKLALHYVFEQLALTRLTFAVSSDNIRSIKLVTALGAVHEATLREAGKSKEDLHIYALRPESCPIWRKLRGKKQQRTAGRG